MYWQVSVVEAGFDILFGDSTDTHSCAVNAIINPAQSGNGLAEEFAHGILLRNIDEDGFGILLRVFCDSLTFGDGVSCRVDIQVCDDNSWSTFLGKQDGAGSADSAA